MKVLQVSAKNYRTLVDFSHTFPRAYCTISGQNNSGKSAVIRLLNHFLIQHERYYVYQDGIITYERDKTQWVESEDLTLGIKMAIGKEEDSEIYFILNSFTPEKLVEDEVILEITEVIKAKRTSELTVIVQGHTVDTQTASAILKKLRSSKTLYIHNSTNHSGSPYYYEQGLTELADTQIDDKDRKSLRDAETRLRNKIGQIARKQKEDLSQLIGRLNEDY